MGLLDFFRRKALTADPGVVEALQDRTFMPYRRLGGGSSGAVNAAFEHGLDASYGWMYRTQPAVRSVVDFIARNASQLPLKLFERVDDTERERREDHPAAETLAYPNEQTTGTSFLYALFADYLVYGNAYFLKFRPDVGETLTLVRLLPEGVTVTGGRFTPEYYTVWRQDGTFFRVSPEDIFHWRGYNPQDPLLGLSPLETLRQELAADSAMQAMMVELSKSGLRRGHIERPLDAPEWTPEAARRWGEEWRRQNLSKSTPVLEEGMKYVQDSMSPRDAQALESRKFTEQEVARVYGLPLGALGLNETDLPEQRKQVYTDVLPPITESLACQLDVDVLRGEYGETKFYFEFDMNEKLRGDAEARFSAITAAAGRPWLTVNEVRAMENKPPIEDGDALTIPLNVMLAGEGSPALPAPNVMPPQDPNGPPQDGSYREEPKALPPATKALDKGSVPRREREMARQRRAIDRASATVERFYGRQARSLKSKAEKAQADTERWNTELSKDLERDLRHIVELEGGVTASRLGGKDFDMREVENYLSAMAEGTAEGINTATQRDIEDMGVNDALSRARNERAALAGVSIGTRATHFARKEAGRQVGARYQTWIADTDRHAELDGVSVPIDGDWGGITPGSEPNCACTSEITL